MKTTLITSDRSRKYLVILPDNFNAETAYTVIHFNHGDDGQMWLGNEIAMLGQALPKFVSSGKLSGNFVLVAPFGNADKWGWLQVSDDKKFIEKEFKVSQLIFAGYSLGAGQALYMALEGKLPGRPYDAYVAISGYLGDPIAQNWLINGGKPAYLATAKNDAAVGSYDWTEIRRKATQKQNIKVVIDEAGNHGSVADNLQTWIEALNFVAPGLLRTELEKPKVPTFTGFKYGMNYSYRQFQPQWSDNKQSEVMASLGANTARQVVWIGNLQPWFFDQLKFAAGLGITDTSLTINFALDQVKGYDKPALIDGKVNPQNPVAVAVKSVIDGAPSVRFLTILNELDLIKGDWTIASRWNKSDPVATELQNWSGTLQQYIQCLKAAYEVAQVFRPDLFICSGVSNHLEFHAAFIRNGGHYYVNCIDHHAYPVYAAANANNKSVDFAVQSVLAEISAVRKLYPGLPVILTETNVPRKSVGNIYGAPDYQRMFVKAMIQAAKETGLPLITFYELADNDSESEYGTMGLAVLWGRNDAAINTGGTGFLDFAKPVTEVMIPRGEVLERLDWLDAKIAELLAAPIVDLDDKIKTLKSASADWKKGLAERA